MSQAVKVELSVGPVNGTKVIMCKNRPSIVLRSKADRGLVRTSSLKKLLLLRWRLRWGLNRPQRQKNFVIITAKTLTQKIQTSLGGRSGSLPFLLNYTRYVKLCTLKFLARVSFHPVK